MASPYYNDNDRLSADVLLVTKCIRNMQASIIERNTSTKYTAKPEIKGKLMAGSERLRRLMCDGQCSFHRQCIIETCHGICAGCDDTP